MTDYDTVALSLMERDTPYLKARWSLYMMRLWTSMFHGINVGVHAGAPNGNLVSVTGVFEAQMVLRVTFIATTTAISKRGGNNRRIA